LTACLINCQTSGIHPGPGFLFRPDNYAISPNPFPCIIHFMIVPDRLITEKELRRNTGERGSRKFIAYHGIVYDVTECPKWRLDLHENLHFPGQDLTSELPEAPHQEDVFTRPCVKVIGKLQTLEAQ